MIKAEILYTVQCDRCGEILKGDEYTYMTDSKSALQLANESEWITKWDKHYCPECYTINDNNEEEIKRSIPPQIFILKKLLRMIVTNSALYSIKESKESFELSGYLKGKILSQAKIEIIKEISQPFEVVIQVVPIPRASNSRLIVEIMKEVKK